jgi:hypothetical protein
MPLNQSDFGHLLMLAILPLGFGYPIGVVRLKAFQLVMQPQQHPWLIDPLSLDIGRKGGKVAPPWADPGTVGQHVHKHPIERQGLVCLLVPRGGVGVIAQASWPDALQAERRPISSRKRSSLTLSWSVRHTL